MGPDISSILTRCFSKDTAKKMKTQQLTDLPSWAYLKKKAQDIQSKRVDKNDIALKIITVGGIKFDLTRQRINQDTLEGLFDLSEETFVSRKIEHLISGEPINVSEGKAALHLAERSPRIAKNLGVSKAIQENQRKMLQLEKSINTGERTGFSGKPFTDVVQIGIGGSHIGPNLLIESLRSYSISHLHFHFISNIDSTSFLKATAKLNPETTMFIVISKSFTTLETLVNFNTAQIWFSERTNRPNDFTSHCLAVTGNENAAIESGVPPDSILSLSAEVGGRYSIWSSGGLTPLLSIGAKNFSDFLRGAEEMDTHFSDAKIKENIPLISALISIWNYNFLNSKSHALLVYTEKMRLLVDYLQQLEMESNGKSYSVDNDLLQHKTVPIIWGGTGTNGQHSFHQLLHQGTNTFSATFFLVGNEDNPLPNHQEWLLANALGQASALDKGINYHAKKKLHKNLSGNRSSSTIILEELNPKSLGALLAYQEHKVFCEGAIWNINSFDQWGVEHGKYLARNIKAEIDEKFPNINKTLFDDYNHLTNLK